MDNYRQNNMNNPPVSGRPPQPQPPPPPGMSHNPQGHLSHMYGNYNNQPNTGFPQINMPVRMPPPVGAQPNANMPGMQRQYPLPAYPNPSGHPSGSDPSANFPPVRPREWETPDQRAAIERESKRPRPYQGGMNDAPYPNQQQGAFNRNTQMGIGIQHHGQRPPVIAPPGHQMSRMPTNAPAIHPPSHPYAGRGAFPPPIQVPPQVPPQAPIPQSRDNFSYMGKPLGQYPVPRPSEQGPSYDGMTGPNRKDVPLGSKQSSAMPPNQAPSDETLESKQQDENPISFKDFLLKQPDAISPQDAKEKYDQYVREFMKKKPNKFFDLHKDEEWFKERYDPDYVLERAVRIKQEVQARAKDFRQLWDKGGSLVCAPDISSASIDQKHGKSSAIPHSYEFGENSEIPEKKTDGSDQSFGERKEESDKMKNAGPKTSENGQQSAQVKKESPQVEKVPVASSTKERGNVNNNASSEKPGKEEQKGEPNAQLVDGAKKEKNVANSDISPTAQKEEPDEKAGKELSSGSIKEEGSLAEKADACEKPPENETKERDEKKSDTPAGVETSEDEKLTNASLRSDCSLVLPLRREHQKHTIFMRGIPVNLNREDLTEKLKHGREGDLNLDLRRLKIGDINPIRGLERFAWAVYASEEAAATALEKVKGVFVRSSLSKKSSDQSEEDSKEHEVPDDSTRVYEIDCMLNLQRKKKYTQGRILPQLFGTPERMDHDVEQSVKMMRYLDNLRKVGDEMNPLTDTLLKQLSSNETRLDHVVTYLREVHYFCYYSGNEFLEDSTSMPPQELRPCGARLIKTMSESDARVVRRVDERAKWVLERDYDRPRSNSDSAEFAKRLAIQEWLDANTKNEGQGRFRCGLPPHKLFKGPEFVHKHLRTKHADKMESIQMKAYMETYRANFENDPSKEEVISIYNDGLANAQQKASGGRGGVNQQEKHMQSFGVPPGRAHGPMGMYNPTRGFMGMGMQPFPMMMVPPAPGYPSSYATTGTYPNPMALAGRGMGGIAGQAMPASGMIPGGMPRGDAGSLRGRPSMRGRDGHRDSRDGIYRGGSHREGGHHGGRRGSYIRRGADHSRRERGDGRPLDPRASGPRRTYNDLDAPANGPSFDLVRYDDV